MEKLRQELRSIWRIKMIDTIQEGWIFMPTIFFYGPELEKEKKRELIRAFTAAASRATGIPQSAFVVYLRKSGEEDVGVGGELLADRKE